MKIIFVLSLFAILITSCGEKTKTPENSTDRKERTQNIYSTQISENVLGESSTAILDDGENRVHNIKLACEKISGTLVYPEETFSFNEIVGERTTHRGFKEAPIIFHGEKSYGTGGGICQVSSTLYMATTAAGMKILERHPHSETVSYAPGTDATVAYDSLDFKFKNNTGNVICVYTWVQDNTVYAKIITKQA